MKNKSTVNQLFLCQRYLAQNANWGHLQDRIGIWMCWFFEERGKPEYPEKNLSEQGREPTTNSTHV